MHIAMGEASVRLHGSSGAGVKESPLSMAATPTSSKENNGQLLDLYKVCPSRLWQVGRTHQIASQIAASAAFKARVCGKAKALAVVTRGLQTQSVLAAMRTTAAACCAPLKARRGVVCEFAQA